MTAEHRVLSDCERCRSAGSVRAGRCQICEWEAPGLRPVRVPAPKAAAPVPAATPTPDDRGRDRDGGTLAAAAG